MEAQFITREEFNQFLEERCRERINELVQEIRAFEYIKRDRGLWAWERARYRSLGSILKINEEILKGLNSEYISIQ